MAKEENAVYVELRFSPSWALISDVRRFVDVFFRRTLEDSDAASRVALAAHELLENATKYSTDGEARLRLEVEPIAAATGTTPRLTIHVSNRTNMEEIEHLQKRFAAMSEEPNPFRYYQQLLRSARGRRERAGLGLARIQAEADVELTMEIEGDVVHIRGRTQIQHGQEQDHDE